MNMFEYAASKLPPPLPTTNIFEYMADRLSTWHVVSMKSGSYNVTMEILASKEDAELYRDRACMGYYKDCVVKEVTANYAHWCKSITAVPTNPKKIDLFW